MTPDQGVCVGFALGGYHHPNHNLNGAAELAQCDSMRVAAMVDLGGRIGASLYVVDARQRQCGCKRKMQQAGNID